MKYISLILAIILTSIAILLGIGYFELCLGIIPTDIPIVLEGTLEYLDIKYQLIGQDIGPLVVLIPCVWLSSVLFSYYHRLKRKKKDTFDTRSIKEPFVLYLRSFNEDKTTRKQVSFNDLRSEEEILVEVLSDIAPVYAIGDPKDKGMPIGASRIYVDDENWKATVADMADKSVAVALRLGKTDSFWWEVEMVLQNIPIEKLLFIIPESKTFNNVAYLYKALIEHNIDIKAPNISIEQKSSGSISSFLFFGNEGEAITREIKTPRLTRMFLSYENIIRNTLDTFRAKYGLSPTHKPTVGKARLFITLLILYIFFTAGAQIYSDLTSLKYQIPYELVEKCIEQQEFKDKYSDDINGTNLVYSLIEARKGAFILNDDTYKSMYLIELDALESMSTDEFAQLGSNPKNLLLMVKKYLPEDYDTYTDILSEAAIMAIRYPEKINELIALYKSQYEYMPTWVEDAVYPNSTYDNEHEYILNYNHAILQHINDADIVDILKTLTSLSF